MSHLLEAILKSKTTMRRTARIAGNVSHLYRLVTCSRVTLFSTIGPCHGWATAPARRSSSSYSKEPYDDWIINPHLRQHLRPSLAPNLNDNDAIDQSRDTGMSLIFLGTGAGKPTPKRSNAATALRRGGNVYLIDAGEGVQLQIMKSKLSGAKVTKIFITHMHGDHIFGLPGMLLSLQISAKVSKQPQRRTVQVYGPVGIYNYIASSLSLTSCELSYLSVQVYELLGGSRRMQHPGATRTYSEFRHRGLQRRTIPQNADGTWTIAKAAEIETEEDAKARDAPQGEYIYAAEVHHVPKLQCFGYVFREPYTQPRSIDKEKALAAGIRPGRKYKLLKNGFPVMSDDGSRQVEPDEVLVGERPPSRSAAFLGDCFHVPSPMRALCENVDVMVHEATFLESDTGDKIDNGGHSTAAAAAKVADAVRAKCLLLNHIGSGPVTRAAEMAIMDEAESAISGRTMVQLAYDHLELQLPRTELTFENGKPKVDV